MLGLNTVNSLGSSWLPSALEVAGGAVRVMVRAAAALALASAVVLSAGCSGTLHLADDHVTSAARTRALDIRALTCEPVTTLGIIAPAGIQGLSPTVAYALTATLSRTSPRIRAVPMPETLNRLADNDLTGEYGELIAGFGRTGTLQRDRLKRIGDALGSRYVMQPGLAEFSQGLFDKFELWGIKIVRTRIATVRLWLQIWEAPTGHLLWESTGELTTAAPVVRQEAMMSLDDMAQTLWARMLEKDLFEGLPRTESCT